VSTSLTTTYRCVWIINSRKIDGAKIEDFKYLSKGKVFPVPTLFIASLLEDEQCLSMGEEVGTMQFLRVQRGVIKKKKVQKGCK
jgi:hypothetical protein